MIENTALVRKLGAFVALSDAELSVLASLHKRRRTFVAGRDLVHQGQSDQAAYILASGWACSYKLLEDGQRQIVDFQIPGDITMPELASALHDATGVRAHPNAIGKFLRKLGHSHKKSRWLPPSAVEPR